jgi:hypothetical protein
MGPLRAALTNGSFGIRYAERGGRGLLLDVYMPQVKAKAEARHVLALQQPIDRG